MKKIFKADMLPLFVLAAGILGMLLRLWQCIGGTDKGGLLIPGHISGILLVILSAATLLLILLGTWGLRQGSKYRYNFPSSIQGAIGALIAAAAVLVVAISCLTSRQDLPTAAAGIIGIPAAICLAVLGLFRFQGRQPHFLIPGCVCLFLMMFLICQYRIWSSEPQVQSYCYSLLATVFVMLSCYQSTAFAANFGARRPHAFFHLAALYFCFVSLIGDHMPLFYLAMGAWMLTDLCRLRPLPRRISRGEEE